MDKLYFLKIFNYAINTDEAKGKGSAIKNIPPFKILKNIPVPLAPINEQKRIVECLEEVFPEIDKLNTFEYDLDTLQNVFPEKMKAAILQYAVKGKLTEQLKSDGDARDLVKDIQNEKSFLIRKRKIPKEKSLPKITEDEIPYDIPDNWCWVRLGTISYNHGLKNAGRIGDVGRLNQLIEEITLQHTADDLIGLFKSITLPASKINTLAEVVKDPLVERRLLHSKDEKTGTEITMAPPPYMTPWLEHSGRNLSFPPRFGEHNGDIYCGRLGYDEAALTELKERKII